MLYETQLKQYLEFIRSGTEESRARESAEKQAAFDLWGEVGVLGKVEQGAVLQGAQVRHET